MLAGCGGRRQAPDVGYTLLDGRPARLSDLRGHVVLVDFWSTDCAPCVAEMPQLARIWRRLSPRGFDALAVSMRYDPPTLVSDFAQRRHLPFGVAIDLTGDIAARLGPVDVTPTWLLIDKRGRIAARWIGRTNFDLLERQVDALLRE
ncbi:MAG TPA: TlpA disulfide reductase family protein [Burkholderiaceae bacterium]